MTDEPDSGRVPDGTGTPASAGATDAEHTGGEDRERDDWLLRAIEQVQVAGHEATTALTRSLENVAEVRRQRESGVPVDSIIAHVLVSGGPEARRATEHAFHRYQHAVMVLRALMIRTLVDNSGSSLSEVAREMKISRQKVTQLYRIGRSLAEAPEEE